MPSVTTHSSLSGFGRRNLRDFGYSGDTMKWFALLVLMGCTVLATQSAAVPPAAVTKKLLEFGWDKPRLPNYQPLN